MCGIAGILSKKGENVVPLVGTMLSCMTNRGPDGAGIAVADSIIQSDSLANLEFEELSGSKALGHVRLAIVGGTHGQQPFHSCNGKFTLEHNGEIYNYKKIRRRLIKHHQFVTQTDSEVIVHLLEDHFNKKNDLLYAIRKTVAELDGVYALVIKDEETENIALVRDKMGVRQIYYGENDRFVAFASERKALWKTGIKEPTHRVLPGHAVIITSDGLIQKFKVSHTPTHSKNIVREVICYTGGIQGSSDIEFARQIAKRLNLKLRVNELTQDEVEQMIPEVINTIEDTNAGQIEVAVPVYAAVKLAHQDGINVMFSGQAADELFGGYSWYAKVVEKEGYEKLREHMTEDMLLLYRETLEREDKITMSHSIEMREPFLDMEVIAFSMQVDMKLNVKGADDAFGKHVHRKLAQKLGIPRNIAYRVKEAAQHGSGMHDVFSAIARKHGFDESTISKQYLNALQSREKIGSS